MGILLEFAISILHFQTFSKTIDGEEFQMNYYYIIETNTYLEGQKLNC